MSLADVQHALQDYQLAETVGKELAWFLGLVPSKQGVETRDGPKNPAELARSVVALLAQEMNLA